MLQCVAGNKKGGRSAYSGQYFGCSALQCVAVCCSVLQETREVYELPIVDTLTFFLSFLGDESPTNRWTTAER